MKRKTSRGFTLIELIVVVAILAILALILVPSIMGYTIKARESVCQSNRGSLKRLYAETSVLEKYSLADNTVGVSFLLDKGYVNAAQANSAPLNAMVWRVYDTGTVDVFCSSSEASVASSMYQNTFDSMNNLTVLKGSFEVVNGQLKPKTNGENRAIFNGSNGTDYTIQMNAVYLAGASSQSGYGIYYRATETANISGYAFQFDPGSGNAFVVREVVNGKESGAVQRVTMTSVMGTSFDIKQPHDIKIEVVGVNQVISVDGVQVLKFASSTFSSGSVGVRTWNNTDARFNDVTITKK
jgi:prepilin-type N-terminal cleavage/methylation domain-containing protein